MKDARFCWTCLMAAVLILSGCATGATPPAAQAEATEAPVASAPPAEAPVRPVVPETRGHSEAVRGESEIANAKAAVAREPKNWRVFSDLGIIYYKQARYDQAISAFQQALALHAITLIIETENQQEAALAAQRAALAAKREADVQRVQEMKSKQEMSELFGMVSSIAGMNGNSQSQMLLSTLESVNNQMNSTPVGVPQLSPEIKRESSLKAKCEVANIYVYLGAAYFGKKDYQQTVAALDSALQLDPSRTETLKTTAEAQYFLSRYGDCIATLAKYHAIAPVEPATLLRLSDAYRALGMEPEAQKSFASFLANQNRLPADSVKLMEIGALCLSHWQYKDSLEFLTKAKHLADSSPDQARRLFDAQRKQFQMDNAIALLLAEAYSNVDRISDAIALLHDATTKDPSNAKAWYMLARCFDESGEPGKAATAYANALKGFAAGQRKTSFDTYIEVCRAATGDGDQAVQTLEQRLTAVPLTPGGGVDQWCYLAFAYEKAGRIPEAMEIFNRCHDATPAYVKAGQALDRLGKQVAPERKQILAESDAALKSGDKNQAIAKLAEAYRLAAAGQDKEGIRKMMLTLAAGIDPAPTMTSQAQDHYLRGNVALKTAKNPMDLGRSLSEFEWAVFYSPWVGDLYFNTSAVKKLQNQTAAAVNDLKLYLAANPRAANVDEILNRLYEFDYQREQKLRELAAIAAF